MPKIIDNGDDSVHLEDRGDSIELTIGVEPYQHKGRGKNRNSILNLKQVRKLALALLVQAEKLDERQNPN
jgi:hypothetical protein